MKKSTLNLLATMFVAALSMGFVSCGDDDDDDPKAGQVTTFTANGVKFAMVYVEGGTFQMGNETGLDSEKPVHEVKLNSFQIGQIEVTQELWEAVMGTNPCKFKGNKRPVEQVNWYDCQEFITKLNELTGKHFRLPTEAEWEFAARGGTKSKGYKYSGSDDAEDVAWCESNSGSTTHEVATKAPNELGIYDMSGNVEEWCQDRYDPNYYSISVVNNPTGPASGSDRVLRGGNWWRDARDGCVSSRYYNSPENRPFNSGLRLAL